MKNFKKNGGFTLVELIVVIAILAILAAVAIPTYSGYIAKAEKANDLQLLGAINDAFAAACLENDIYTTDLEDATYHVASHTITGLTKTGVTYDVAVVNASYQRYFAGNAGTPFKVLKALEFNPVLGVFEGVEISDNVVDALANLQNYFVGSSLNAQQIVGEVQDLTNAMENAIANMGMDALEEVLGSNGAFTTYLTNNGVDTTNPQEIANHAALFVAGQVAGADQTALQNAWTSNNFAYGVGMGATGIQQYKDAGLSTMGAMAMYYANMEACVENLKKQSYAEGSAEYTAQQEVITAFNNISANMGNVTDVGAAMELLMDGYDNMYIAAAGNTTIAGVVTGYGSTAQGATDAAAALNAMGEVNKNAGELKDLTGSNNMYGHLAGLFG